MTSAAAERFEIPGTGARVVRGEVRLAPEATGSVVLVHGFKGFGRFAFFPYLADRLAASGLTAVTFNSSGSGVGADLETFTELDALAENSYTREMQDLALVVAEAERRGWTGPQFGLFGHSRGGAVALLHAARDARVRALVTWASIANVVRWSDEEMAAWRERGYLDVPNTRTGQQLRLSTTLLDETTEHHLGRLNLRIAAATLLCPWLIVHGDADETVPFEEGEQLHAASDERAELLRIAGGTHTFNVAHGMTDPSPQLSGAADRSIDFFVDRLVTRR